MILLQHLQHFQIVKKWKFNENTVITSKTILPDETHFNTTVALDDKFAYIFKTELVANPYT